MTKNFRMLEVDIDKNNEKIDEITRELNGIQKAIHWRRQRQKHHR